MDDVFVKVMASIGIISMIAFVADKAAEIVENRRQRLTKKESTKIRIGEKLDYLISVCEELRRKQ